MSFQTFRNQRLVQPFVNIVPPSFTKVLVNRVPACMSIVEPGIEGSAIWFKANYFPILQQAVVPFVLTWSRHFITPVDFFGRQSCPPFLRLFVCFQDFHWFKLFEYTSYLHWLYLVKCVRSRPSRCIKCGRAWPFVCRERAWFEPLVCLEW